MDHQTVILLGALAGALVTIVGFWKVLLPGFSAVHDFFKDIRTALHIFNGRGGFVDEVTGKQVQPVPPLGIVLAEIRSEQTTQGKSIERLTEGFQQMTDQQAQINALRTDVDLIKAGVVERAANRIENAALFDMIAKRDSAVIDGDAVE